MLIKLDGSKGMFRTLEQTAVMNTNYSDWPTKYKKYLFT